MYIARYLSARLAHHNHCNHNISLYQSCRRNRMQNDLIIEKKNIYPTIRLTTKGSLALAVIFKQCCFCRLPPATQKFHFQQGFEDTMKTILHFHLCCDI